MKKSVMIGLAVGLLAALLLALWAWNQRNEAVYQASVTATAQSIAEEQRLEAEAARTTAVAEAQRRATEPPPSPTVTPTATPSPTPTPTLQVVHIQPDSSQAEPGQPVTIRVEGLPPSVIAGQDVACVVLEDEGGQSVEGPWPLSPDESGISVARITISNDLAPGTYRLTVFVCGTILETPPDLESTPPPPPSPLPLATVPYTVTARIEQPDRVRRIPSPDGRWIAIVNETTDSLNLQSAEGETLTVFPEGSTVGTADWSPDSRYLLVVRTNWMPPQPGVDVQASGPAEIWQVRVEGDQVREPVLLFRPAPQPGEQERDIVGPSQITLGQWSPDSRYVLFWLGPPSASIMADGNEPWVVDVETGEATQPADWALLNPRYQSWAPDSSALAITAGGYRSAQVNKWLNLFDVASGQVTTVVSQTEQIPGIVAWSPQGDLIAYAAVPAAETGPDLADWMSFENPAIAGRRVYLLDPTTGLHWPLNDTDAFQDAPTWSDDGSILYYVQRQGDTMALMAADPATGQAQVIEGSRRPAPGAVGYYGQSDWDDLLAHRPEAPKAAVPPLTETYIYPTYGYTLRYPAGWHVGQGWQSLYGWQEIPTLSSYPPDASSPDLGPFSGQALIAIQAVEVSEGDLEALLDRVLASSGPGQILDRNHILTTFDQRELTAEGRPAIRLETMGEFGTVNHVLLVLDGTQGFVLRGWGDGRVFGAVAGSLRLQ
jgi:hypothetical protein